MQMYCSKIDNIAMQSKPRTIPVNIGMLNYTKYQAKIVLIIESMYKI
jgi:hypothetical protein